MDHTAPTPTTTTTTTSTDTSTPPSSTSNESKAVEESSSITTTSSSGAIMEIPAEPEVKHPLHNRWTLWFDNPGRKTSQQSWADHLRIIQTFDTVEDFWRLWNNIVPASRLQLGSNFSLFKDGIEPKWEDPANSHGGKWLFTITTKQNRKELLDQYWLYTALALIGETFRADSDICGSVVSIRKPQDKIALWTRDTDAHATTSIGQDFRKALELPSSIVLGYQAHQDSIRNNSSWDNSNKYQV